MSENEIKELIQNSELSIKIKKMETLLKLFYVLIFIAIFWVVLCVVFSLYELYR